LKHFLGSTHAQIDEYSRRRNDEISEAVKTSIEKIVHETQIHQQQLLNDAQKQSNEIDKEYKEKLML
jgi:gas vesicle protein